MRHKLLLYEIFACLLCITFGTLFHFVYAWSDNNIIVGLFTPVNESTWEHLKLLITPLVALSFIEYPLLGRRYNNFFYYKSIGMLVGIAMIICGFYIYTGIIGRSFMTVDILLFYFSIFLSYRNSYRMIRLNPTYTNYNYLGVLILLFMVLLCIAFTLLPPKIQLFMDPLGKGYGV